MTIIRHQPPPYSPALPASTMAPSDSSDSSSAPDLFRPPLRTKGRYILDADDKRFKLAAVNWYGSSDELFVPSGLDKQSRQHIARLIRSIGFNSVRMPYSDEMVMKNPLVADALLAANPDLHGQRALDIFVACVEALTEAGLAVIINDHITYARWCDGMSLCDAAWYNDNLPRCRVRLTEARWMQNWERVMARFVANPRVVGCDLRNEVRGIWGTMTWNMWATAAEKCGRRLQKMSRDWLIIVEGVSSANDISGARKRPVVLDVPDHVVYSSHVYAWSGWGQMDPYSRRSYPSFVLAMYRNWGYLLQEDIAPVWVGEMGAPAHPGKGDAHYWRNLLQYCDEMDVDFGYWAINPRKPHENEKETWALVDDNWSHIIDDYRLQGMRRLMKPIEEKS